MGDWKRLSRGIRRKQRGKQGLGNAAHRRARTASDRGALSFETLEDRRVLATFLVTNLADNGLGSLRWALNSANADAAPDTIVFSENAFLNDQPGTIRLTSGALTITQPAQILGPGPRKLTVEQTGVNQRVFDVNIGGNDEVFRAQVSGMTIMGGNVLGDNGRGGGVYNRENLTMTEVVLDGNSASAGGGGVFTEFGSLTLDRSLVQNNSGGNGGGILNGSGEDESRPTTTISNTTIRLNTSGEFGGGVMNRSGTLNIRNSTISENTAGMMMGDGVASWGNPVPEEEGGEPPAPIVFTNVSHSIIFGNGASDFDRVGETDDDPPVPLLPSVTSEGFNIVGTGNTADMGPPQSPDFAFSLMSDQVGAAADPRLENFDDYGGSTDVYLLGTGSTAIDAGDPNFEGVDFEQRGRHFTRIFDFTDTGTAVVDIGATEMQAGVFVVDTLLDVVNFIYSKLFTLEFILGQPQFEIFDYETEGNFSIREALDFASKNPGIDTIRFSDNLISLDVLENEDLTASKSPTILLVLGALIVDEDLVIEGPSNYILEIDASGNDPTPNTNNGDGSRVFVIDDLDALVQSKVSISNLTLMGADVVGSGGGVLTREDLDLSHMTLKENNATNDGGGLFVARGNTTVEGTTFNNNRAADDGGAVFVDTAPSASQSTFTIVNSTLSANVAGDRGAGVYNSNGRVDVRFSTITLNNSSSTIGSGIHNAGADALASLWASVVSNNVSNDVSFSAGALVNSYESLGHNYIGRGNGNTVFVQVGDSRNANNPMLHPLFNTGGLVETHRPQVGSPLIDAGPVIVPGSDPPGPTFDQRGNGFTRVFDGNQDATPRADIGAYELQGLTLKVDNPLDENDGNISANNFSLREAVALANENPLFDVIEFDPIMIASLNPANPAMFLGNGTLLPGTPSAIRITDHLTINGPGQGLLALDGSLLDDPSLTIDGSQMFVVDDGNAAAKINVTVRGLAFRNALASASGSVFHSKENLTLDGVTLINNSTIADPDNLLTGLHGGALYQETGKLTINNSLLTGNSTADVAADGGAVYILDGELEINDSTLSGNSTEQSNSDGGAVYVKNSTFTVNFSTISGNITSGGVADGGGFFSEGSIVTLNEAVVSGNSTVGSNSEGGGFAAINSAVTLNDTVVGMNNTFGNQSSGAGAFATGGTLTANRSLFRENKATGQGAFGGGVATSGGTVNLFFTSVTNNQTTGSSSHGGGVANLGGVVVVRNSTIADNHATHSQSKGGGVYSDTNLTGTQSTLILNSTVSTNSAPLRGGGVFNADGITEIRHSTITNNSSSFLNVGSGVASQGNAATQTRVFSSIIAGNLGSAAGTGSDVDSVDAGFLNSFVSLGYNVIGTGNSAAAFNQTGDQKNILNPLLGPLDSNGQSPTILFDLRTHALLEGSPAINAGSPSFNPNAFSPALTTDERGNGFARVKQGRIDVGAFESDFVPALPADFNGNGMVDGNDFLAWQRNFGKTNAIKADGDANGDGAVNGQDLDAWKAGFGTVAAASASVVSAGAFMSAALIADATSADKEPATPTTPAGDSQKSSADYTSLASLGGPVDALPARRASAAQAVDRVAAAWRGAANTGYSSVSAALLLRDNLLDELDLSPVADDADADQTAEDAAFSAWGEELL